MIGACVRLNIFYNILAVCRQAFHLVGRLETVEKTKDERVARKRKSFGRETKNGKEELLKGNSGGSGGGGDRTR